MLMKLIQMNENENKTNINIEEWANKTFLKMLKMNTLQFLHFS